PCATSTMVELSIKWSDSLATRYTCDSFSSSRRLCCCSRLSIRLDLAHRGLVKNIIHRKQTAGLASLCLPSIVCKPSRQMVGGRKESNPAHLPPYDETPTQARTHSLVV